VHPLDFSSNTESLEGFNARYLPSDIEKIKQIAVWLNIPENRAVPRIGVRVLYDLCQFVFTFKFLARIIFYVYKDHVLSVAQRDLKEKVVPQTKSCGTEAHFGGTE